MRVVDASEGARTDWGLRSLPGFGLVIGLLALSEGSCDAEIVSFIRNNV